VTLDIAESWIGEHVDTDWLVKHASRTLLKQGDPRALFLFGFTNQSILVPDIKLSKTQLTIGESFEFSFDVYSETGDLGKTRIEYAIDFVKANGKCSKKVFKISEGIISSSEKPCKKKHSFKQLSTRTHYAGRHRLSVIVNGVEKSAVRFELLDSN
jgi:hypothetical protein